MYLTNDSSSSSSSSSSSNSSSNNSSSSNKGEFTKRQLNALNVLEKSCEAGDVESCYFTGSHHIRKGIHHSFIHSSSLPSSSLFIR